MIISKDSVSEGGTIGDAYIFCTLSVALSSAKPWVAKSAGLGKGVFSRSVAKPTESDDGRACEAMKSAAVALLGCLVSVVRLRWAGVVDFPVSASFPGTASGSPVDSLSSLTNDAVVLRFTAVSCSVD